MNLRLLRRIQKQILKEPKQFHMDNWFADKTHFLSREIKVPPIPNCGTTACIGGWAVALTKKQNPAKARVAQKEMSSYKFEALAADTLGLDDQQAQRLFHDYNWPNQFYPATAKRAVRRIEHFVKTNGEE